MNRIIKIAASKVSVVVMMFLCPCGAKVEKEDMGIIEAEQEVTLEASAFSMQLSIYELSRAITEIQNTSDWLTIVQEVYVSGTPVIKISCTENNEPSKRVAIVTIKTREGDKVTLTVIQKMKTEIDDSHNTASDKPPYAPVR